MDVLNSALELPKINDSEPSTRQNSMCFSERAEFPVRPRLHRYHSDGDIMKSCSYDVAAETMRRNSLEEVSENMQQMLDEQTNSILESGEVSNENSLKKKTFLMNMFRTAVLKVIKDTSGDEFEDNIAPLADDPNTNLTLLPTQKTKAIYLSQVFKYAVKQTIIHRRQEKESGNPWDEFFYRIYSAERPRMDNARRCLSAGIKLKLKRDLLEDHLNLDKYDLSVKDKLTLNPFFKRSTSSGNTDRGKKAFDNLSRVSSNISKKVQREMNERNGMEHLGQHATLPKLVPVRRSREEEQADERGRFRVGRVRHSPDGRSPLSRLFYLPLIPSKK